MAQENQSELIKRKPYQTIRQVVRLSLGGRAVRLRLSNGDEVAAPPLRRPTTATGRFFLSEVDVDAPAAGAVVTLGACIADGYGSTLDANSRCPDVLAERLAAANLPLPVLDAGISGNRVIHDQPEAQFGSSALARLDRDVLSVPDVRTVVVMESIDDIGHPGSADLPEQAVSADDIVAGLRQIVDRAHGKGLRVLGATLTTLRRHGLPRLLRPGRRGPAPGCGPVHPRRRSLRRRGGLRRLLRDSAQPDHIAAEYDFGDHLHPNDAGYRKMGEAVDLKAPGAD